MKIKTIVLPTKKGKVTTTASIESGEDDEEDSGPSLQISASEINDDPNTTMAQVLMQRTITSPRIGHYNVADELNIRQMKKGKTYRVPLHVGQHMKDTGACVIVGDADSALDDSVE